MFLFQQVKAESINSMENINVEHEGISEKENHQVELKVYSHISLMCQCHICLFPFNFINVSDEWYHFSEFYGHMYTCSMECNIF